MQLENIFLYKNCMHTNTYNIQRIQKFMNTLVKCFSLFEKKYLKVYAKMCKISIVNKKVKCFLLQN